VSAYKRLVGLGESLSSRRPVSPAAARRAFSEAAASAPPRRW
jgi:hypothetical protein